MQVCLRSQQTSVSFVPSLLALWRDAHGRSAAHAVGLCKWCALAEGGWQTEHTWMYAWA